MITAVRIYENPTYEVRKVGKKDYKHEKQARVTVLWQPLDKISDGKYVLSTDPERKAVERHIYVSLERGIQAINQTS